MNGMIHGGFCFFGVSEIEASCTITDTLLC